MSITLRIGRRTLDYLGGELAAPDRRQNAPLPSTRAVYAHMPLGPISAAALRDWARGRGVVYDEPNLHVTTAYSLAPVPVAPTYRTRDARTADNAHGLVVHPGGRSVRLFGTSLVLCLECPALTARWQAWRDAGAEWDYPDYTPHVTFADLKHQGGATIDASEAFDEPITLLPEVVERPRSSY